MPRLIISDLELLHLDERDFKWTRLSDNYLVRLLQMANDLGLQGKKIKEIIGIQEDFANHQRYIDFICEDSNP